MQTVTIKNPKNTVLFLVLIALFSSVGIIASNSAFLISNEIYQGVSIAGISVGGLSKEAAANKLAEELLEKLDKPVITIHYGKQSWKLLADDIEYHITYNDLAAKAYQVGRQGNIFHQMKERYITVNQGYELPLSSLFSEEKLKQGLEKIAKTIDREPESATLSINGAHKRIHPETIGLKTNITKAFDEAKQRLLTATNITIQFDVEEIMPEIQAAHFNEINGIIGSYSTQFNPENVNRTENIVQAARSIDHTLIVPGEVFSFNKNVGLRLAANGYKEAPVYIGNDLVPGIGGGVCQVSTTLYNAVLLSDMAIIERSPHIRPPGYVPLGQDATVADNLIDFAFKNTTDANAYIRTFLSDNQITVVIYGKIDNNTPEIMITSNEPKIIEPNTIVKQDENMEIGKQVIEEEGQKGFIVSSYRIKYLHGREISREHLATDEFAPVDKVIRVGIKPNPKEPPPAKTK